MSVCGCETCELHRAYVRHQRHDLWWVVVVVVGLLSLAIPILSLGGLP